ncbi:MAG: PAS domain S-box protein [Chloroflexota bacterium]|nr:MAG: PAS domain S-box protein [Chloroflexota bacterium]
MKKNSKRKDVSLFNNSLPGMDSAGNFAEHSDDRYHETARRLIDAENNLKAINTRQNDANVNNSSDLPALLSQAHEAIQREQLALVLQIAHLGSWTWDIPSDTVIWSEELYRIFGLSKQEFNHRLEGFIERVHPNDRQMVRSKLDQAIRDGKSFSFDHGIVRPDGSVRVLQARGELVKDKDGNPVAMVGTGQDITERVQAEYALREGEERLRMVISSVKDYAIFTLDPNGIITSWNKGAESIKQYKAEEITGKHFSIFYPEESRAAHLPQKVLAAAAAEGRFADEGWRVRKDGSRFWASVVITALYDDSRRLRGFSKVVRDMTRRKESEEAIRRQTGFVKLLQLVAEAANQAVSVEAAMQFALDCICQHTGWNIGHSYIASNTSTEILSSLQVWHLPDSERFAALRNETETNFLHAGEGLPGKAYASGELIWAQDLINEPGYLRPGIDLESGLRSGVAIPVLAGKWVVGVMEFYSDKPIDPDHEFMGVLTHIGTQLGRVIERKHGEEALRQSEARFRTIFDGAVIGVELVDLEGRLLECNPAICKMLGYDASGLSDDIYGQANHPLNVVADTPMFANLAQGKCDSFRLEKPYRRADGGQAWGRLLVSLVRDSNGRPQYAIGMLEDISERRQMEVELAEMQQRLMEGRELDRLQLAQELHDGPVQDLYGLSYQLKALDPASGEITPGVINDMQNTLHDVVRTLRAICGELRPPALAPFGLEKAIRSHAETFQEAHPEISVKLDLTPDGQMLPEQVRLALFRIYQQSLTNVSRHARATEVFVRFNISENLLNLEIQDNGAGFMLPKRWIELARQGHLGLVGARERAEAIGGQLHVESAPGKGAIVRVTIPNINQHKWIGYIRS